MFESGGKVVLVFRGLQKIEGKISTVKEGKRKKMESETEQYFWLAYPLKRGNTRCGHTHRHTGAKTLRT